MIERSADAWEHNQFKDVIVRVANVEMCVLQVIPARQWTDTTIISATTRHSPSTYKNNQRS